MSRYYLNTQPEPNGTYEVHREGCMWLPFVLDKIPLGAHFSCHEAVDVARAVYKTANGCKSCSGDCHVVQPIPDSIKLKS